MSKRIIAFQGIPLIAAIYTLGIATGRLEVRDIAGLQVALVIGLIMYGWLMSLLLKALFFPVLLEIDDEKRLTWRPYFKKYMSLVPSGSEITLEAKEVRISPPLTAIPSTIINGGATVFPLPQGLREQPSDRFIKLSR